MYDFGFIGGPQILESNLPKLKINDARYHEVNLFFSFSLLDLDWWMYVP